MTRELLKDRLSEIAAELIEDLVRLEPTIREGTVMTIGPASYRRLDCDGRALAYVRTRPKKRAVRIDVTGLWRAPLRSRLRVPSAGGAASLLIRSELDRAEAVRFLQETVARTRAQNAA